MIYCLYVVVFFLYVHALEKHDYKLNKISILFPVVCIASNLRIAISMKMLICYFVSN